ncbi:MAG TPA: protein kinase [Streptosporangiaceae bacterium]
MVVMGSQVLAGRYVLGEVLGTGGMATVWRATDEVLGREVAVKVLSPQYAADPRFAARFEREARHAAQLSHPRLVTVFDCGIDNGTAFIVMELVAGRTLRQVLDDAGFLPPGQAVAIAAAVCEGLEVAHAAGLVHRDIQPANIVLSGGEAKILDFGIARADGTAGGTRTVGVVLGTVAYLSPEQASGHPARLQSDLYSLGCVLFEMLTGEPPFTAESAVGLAHRHIHDDPGPPSARQSTVPAQLDGITTRLLAKNPAARPASAAAARADLLAALNPNAPATPHEDVDPSGLSHGGLRRLSRAEVVLTGALAAALAALVAVLLSVTTAHAAPTAAPGVSPRAAPSVSTSVPRAAPSVSPSASHHSSTSRPAAHKAYKPAHPQPAPKQSVRPAQERPAVRRVDALPPVAAAAATLVGDLAAGVTDKQVAPPAAQDLYNHLQHLLFGPPDQTPQQIQQQYAQLLQSYDQHRQHAEIAGHAAIALRRALRALAAAVGAS